MKDVLVNIGHTAVAKVLLTVVQFAAATILARNLSAQDYGLVGFANVLMALLTRLNGLGLTQAVVRNRALEEKTVDTAASLNVLLSIGAFSCAQLLAPILGKLLDNPALIPVVRVLGIGFLLSPLGFLPTCFLNRDMRFATLRTPSVIGTTVRGILAVGLAITGWKYWSLVIADLAGTLTSNGLLQFLRRVRFRWGIDKTEARKLLRFGIPLTVAGLLTFALLNADNFVIGSVLGAKMLGFYTVALNWATFFCVALQEVVHSVLFPRFSQMQDDPERMRTAYLRSLRVITFSAALVNLALLVGAEWFLVYILGKGTERWLPALGTLRILCLYGVIRATVESVGNPVLALGESRLFTKANGLAGIFEIVLLPFVVPTLGIEGAAGLIVVAYSTQVVFYLPFLARRLRISRWTLFKTVFPVFSAGGAGVSLPILMKLIGVSGEGHMAILSIAVFAISFIAVYEVITRWAMSKEFGEVWRAVRTG